MKRSILRFAALITLFFSIFISCKKSNPLHTYPDNYRIISFNETTTSPAPAPTTFIENYRFIYDGYNRVSQISYTTNDPTKANTISYLTYSNDTIYDTTRLLTHTLVEVDTFVTDLRGFIVTTHMPAGTTNYSYLGNLLTRITYNDSDNSTFTSYYGDFTKQVPSLKSNHSSSYIYYTDLADRAGDYFHIQSFARYGFNFYQNTNLIRFIDTKGENTAVTYAIDADSKITQTTATISDTAVISVSGTPTTFVYQTTKVFDIQYEKYK